MLKWKCLTRQLKSFYSSYAVVTAIANKEAETVADAIFKDWFAKFA
jgi:hypothetical protein